MFTGRHSAVSDLDSDKDREILSYGMRCNLFKVGLALWSHLRDFPL